MDLTLLQQYNEFDKPNVEEFSPFDLPFESTYNEYIKPAGNSNISMREVGPKQYDICVSLYQ
jgi:hypothetical protein